MVRNIPNIISLLRVLAVPVMVWLIIINQLTAAFWLFLAAGVSDAVDGFIAKRFNCQTVTGAFLDPLADKALLISCYATLGLQEHLPGWLVILVIFRDVLIIGGALLFQTLTQALTMQPLSISKLNTFLQILLISLVLARLGLGIEDWFIIDTLIWAVAVSTAVSGGAYILAWGRKAMAMEEAE